MHPLRFGIYAGVIWLLVSLSLVVLSILSGYHLSLVELDFRLFSSAVLIFAWISSLEIYFTKSIEYVQFGFPIKTINVLIASLLGFVDGFLSGFLIAQTYNMLVKRFGRFKSSNITYFGISAGIILGIASGLIAWISILYRFELDSFGYSLRPLSIIFSATSRIYGGELLPTIQNSYSYFPNDSVGVILWSFWGFLDGMIGGLILAVLFITIKSLFRK